MPARWLVPLALIGIWATFGLLTGKTVWRETPWLRTREGWLAWWVGASALLGFALTTTEVALDGYEVIGATGQPMLNVVREREKDEVRQTRALSVGPGAARVPRAIIVRHIGVPIWSRRLIFQGSIPANLAGWPGAAAWTALQQPPQPIPDGWIWTIVMTGLWGAGGFLGGRFLWERAANRLTRVLACS